MAEAKKKAAAKEPDADGKKKEPKPLTAVDVIMRVRGCGRPKANAILAELAPDAARIVEAYKQGAAAVEALLDAAYDKKNPPKKKDDSATKPPEKE